VALRDSEARSHFVQRDLVDHRGVQVLVLFGRPGQLIDLVKLQKLNGQGLVSA
jgi:hypothetical protein